jgi:hypothetical protein
VSGSVVAEASSTVQAGVATGQATTGPAGERIVAVAHDAFLSGYHLAVLVAAAVTLVAAAGVFLWLPARAPVTDGVGVPVPPEPRPEPSVVDLVTGGDGPTPAVEGAVS